MEWVTAAGLDVCATTDDCRFQNTCIEGFCQHKGLWPPSEYDVLLGLIICLLTGLGNAAGIAGGSIIIPIVITVGGFGSHQTIPIVITAIIGGAVVAAVFRINLRHLAADKPRVDYDIALHLMMPVLTGTVFGVMVNAMTPEWVILLLLVSILGYTTYNVFSKAISLQRMQNAQASMEQLIDPRKQENISKELEEIFAVERKVAPSKPIIMILMMFTLVTIFAFLKGGKGVPSILGFKHCSTAFWTTLIVFVSLSLLFSVVTSRYLINKNQYYESVGYPFDKNDFRWTTQRCALLVVLGMANGVAAGLLGLAGGVILAPFLLALNMRAEVANATCSFMVFFMCATSFLQFATSGMVSYDYGGVYCILTAIGSYTGVSIIERYIKKMQSLVVFLLGIVVAIATVLVPLYGVTKVLAQFERGGEELRFKSFC